MASTTELRQHKNDQQFHGDRMQAMALPPLEIASAGNTTSQEFYRSAPWMNPVNRERWAREQADGRTRRLNWRTNPKHLEIYSRKLKESLANPKVHKELAEYRQFELVQDLFAIPFAMAAFQSINLSANELPLLVFPIARQYFDVRFIGQDGGARQTQWLDERSIEQHLMRMISTDKVEYPIWDIQQGSVPRTEVIQASLRFDMEMRLDKLAQDQIDSIETTSGLRDVLNLHPLIDPVNIPDKNYLDLTATNPGVLTIAKWKEILSHINSFGPGIDPARSLAINTVIMSPQNIRDQWDYIDLVSGFSGVGTVQPSTDETVLTSTREEIYRTGLLNHAWGFTWASISNARLPKGRMYVFTNQPVGWFFTKTEMDKLIQWDGPDQQEQNYAQIVWQRCFQFVTPDLWKHRIVIVDL